MNNLSKLGGAILLAVVGLVSAYFVPSSFKTATTVDCLSEVSRPCFDRVTPGKTSKLVTKAGENAFQACMKSKSQSLRGFGQLKTALSDSERYQYCFEGKSTVQVRWFTGSTAPQPAVACNKAPEFLKLSSLDPNWDMRDPVPIMGDGNALWTYYYNIKTMLRSRSGTLFAAGSRSSLAGWVPVLHRSADNGATWKFLDLPDAQNGWGFVYAMAEDANGALYAGGTRLWKSVDDGNTWKAMPALVADTYWGVSALQSMVVTKDNALVASFSSTGTYTSGSLYLPYDFSKVYKSIDGGSTWNELFSHDPTHRLSSSIFSIVEADDGSLVFRDYSGGGGNVYRYINGVVTKTFTDFLTISEPSAGLLKTHDGSLHIIATDTAINLDGSIEYTEPGHGLLAAYTSVDNGITWTKLGTLSHSWTNQGPIIEAVDGALYAGSHSVCDDKGSIYKSTDRGITWSVFAASPKFGTSSETGSWYYFGTLSLLEVSGKVLIGGNAPVIFSTR